MPVAREPSLADPQTTPAKISRKQGALLLALLTMAGAWLRLSHLGSKSLWLDEGATVALARASWQHFAWVWWYGDANLQTTYFLLMRGWIHLGDSEAWLRLPSAVFGIASIPMTYVLARKFMGAAPALASAAMLAFSPAHVYYSQESRSYSLTVLLVLLSCFFFVRAAEHDSRQPAHSPAASLAGSRLQDWMLWTLVSLVAVYAHYFAALVLLAQAGSLFFKQKPAPWRPVLVGGLVVLVVALPGLTYVLRAPATANLNVLWRPRPSAKEFWHLAMFFGGSGVKLALAIPLWLAGICAVMRTRRQRWASGDFWRGMLVLLWILVPVVLTALVSLIYPMFLQRYFLFSLPATVLLAALGMEFLRKGRTGVWLVVLLCGMSIPAIVKEYHKPRQDWRAASNAVLTSAAPGDAVAFFPFYSRIMLDYYRDRYGASAPPLHVFAPAYYDGGEDVRDLLKALDNDPHGFHHVWVLVSDDGKEFYGAAIEEKLQSMYGAPAVEKFANIDVLEYGR